MFGSSALGMWVVIALLEPTYATVIVAVGLVSKHLVEAALSSGWGRVFGDEGDDRWSFNVWLSSLLGFAISNVDFLIIAWIISAEAFSIYSLGFRLSALFVSQISYVVNRVALVDFGEAYRNGTLAIEYARRRRQLFLVGIAAGVLTACGAPVLVLFLGHQWAPVIGVAIVLSIATPWRMCTGLGITTAISVGEAARLSRWEASRLVVATLVLALGALGGLRGFTVAAATVVVLTTVGYDQVSQRFAGINRRSPLLVSIPIAVLLVAVAATVLPFAR